MTMTVVGRKTFILLKFSDWRELGLTHSPPALAMKENSGTGCSMGTERCSSPMEAVTKVYGSKAQR